MHRKAQWPPAVHAHKASGQDRVRIEGRDHYLGRTGTPEARAAYARLVAGLAAGQGPPASARAAPALTVADVVASWLELAGPRLSARGGELAQYRIVFNSLLALYGPTPAAAFDADALEAWRLAVATGSWREGNKGVCANVANRRAVRLKTVWRWAERKKLVPPGSWAGLRALPGLRGNDAGVRHTARRPAAAWGDVKRVALAAPPAVRAMLLLQWWSGMRSGEVRIVRACDVDRTGPVWLYRPAVHKNDWRGQDRVVPLGPKCQALLRPWLGAARSPDAYLFAPRKKSKLGRYTRHTYPQAVRRAARAAGVEGFSAYQCRHSMKRRVTRELGLDAARAMLGQKSLSATDGYAAGVDLVTASEAARRLG